MSLFRSATRRATAAVGAVLLGAAMGIAFVPGATSYALTARGAQASPRSAVRAAPPVQPPGLDHFLCYQVTPVAGVPSFVVPPGVSLTNQFSTAPFTPRFGAASLHCNPAKKIVPAGAFPVQNPSWHLLCLTIAGNQKPATHVVQVTNQFGTAPLVTRQATKFCLPSLTSLGSATGGPPVFTPPGPNEIRPDHFTCYPVSLTAAGGGFTVPKPVRVIDQFSGAAVTVRVGAPKILCVPTQKTVNGKVFPITNAPAHLLCFAVSPTPVKSPIWDRNQFGIGELTVVRTAVLCLPSFKKLIS